MNAPPTAGAALAGLSAALDAMGEALFVLDGQGRLLRMNPAAEELSGISYDEAAGEAIGEILQLRSEGSDRPLSLPLARMLREACPLAPGHQAVLFASDGARRYVAGSGSPLPSDSGGAAGVVLIVRDVSAEHEALESERRRQRELLDLFDGFPDGIAILREGLFVYLNASLSELLGRPLEELLGRPVLDLLEGADRNLAEARFRAAADGESSRAPAIYRMLRPDGSEVLLESSGLRPVEFQGEKATLANLKDVTEREKLRRELGVRDRLASVGTLAAGIAHEINNPLTYVISNARFALECLRQGRLQDPATAAEVGGALAELCEGAERVAGIVSDLKTFARGDPGELGPVDPRKVLEMALRMTTSQLPPSARVALELSPMPEVEGSPVRLGQLFVNLLVNAAQALPPGAPATHQLRISSGTDARGWATIAISDNGVGMSPEVKARIFEPFFTTKPVGKGTGLGLSICHGIVEALHGEIAVESTAGQGTTFTVSLPPLAPA